MAISRREEIRALNADEHALVEKTHHPAVQELSDADLSGLVKLVRERRDKAQTEAHRRRREMRGKGAPKGAAASKADSGSQVKLAVLAMAMRRLNGEAERRRQLAAPASWRAGRSLQVRRGPEGSWRVRSENGTAVGDARQGAIEGRTAPMPRATP